jgi:pimeloyl-ACP methyl ester carboxylesterase
MAEAVRSSVMVAMFDALGAGAAASWRALQRMPGHRREAVAALNGLIGDLLDEQGRRLAVAMQLRPGGEPTSTLCLFLHALMATDDRWLFKGRPGVTFGSLLAEDRHLTPVYVSYNSGRHISANGRDLADRLDGFIAGWPVPVTEINFVGHSMGGLVVRSACHYAMVDGRAWAGLVRRVVLLGAPNRGTGFEQIAHAVNTGLQALPIGTVQALGRLVDRRSAGIKDLRHGSVLDEDWQEGRRHPARLPEGAAVFVGCANLIGDGEHPAAKLLGDVMVSQFSAQGRRPLRSGPLCEREQVRVFSGTGHLGLANSPAVYDQLLAWWQ